MTFSKNKNKKNQPRSRKGANLNRRPDGKRISRGMKKYDAPKTRATLRRDEGKHILRQRARTYVPPPSGSSRRPEDENRDGLALSDQWSNYRHNDLLQVIKRNLMSGGMSRSTALEQARARLREHTDPEHRTWKRLLEGGFENPTRFPFELDASESFNIYSRQRAELEEKSSYAPLLEVPFFQCEPFDPDPRMPPLEPIDWVVSEESQGEPTLAPLSRAPPPAPPLLGAEEYEREFENALAVRNLHLRAGKSQKGWGGLHQRLLAQLKRFEDPEFREKQGFDSSLKNTNKGIYAGVVRLFRNGVYDFKHEIRQSPAERFVPKIRATGKFRDTHLRRLIGLGISGTAINANSGLAPPSLIRRKHWTPWKPKTREIVVHFDGKTQTLTFPGSWDGTLWDLFPNCRFQFAGFGWKGSALVPLNSSVEYPIRVRPLGLRGGVSDQKDHGFNRCEDTKACRRTTHFHKKKKEAMNPEDKENAPRKILHILMRKQVRQCEDAKNCRNPTHYHPVGKKTGNQGVPKGASCSHGKQCHAGCLMLESKHVLPEDLVHDNPFGSLAPDPAPPQAPTPNSPNPPPQAPQPAPLPVPRPKSAPLQQVQAPNLLAEPAPQPNPPVAPAPNPPPIDPVPTPQPDLAPVCPYATPELATRAHEISRKRRQAKEQDKRRKRGLTRKKKKKPGFIQRTLRPGRYPKGRCSRPPHRWRRRYIPVSFGFTLVELRREFQREKEGKEAKKKWMKEEEKRKKRKNARESRCFFLSKLTTTVNGRSRRIGQQPGIPLARFKPLEESKHATNDSPDSKYASSKPDDVPAPRNHVTPDPNRPGVVWRNARCLPIGQRVHARWVENKEPELPGIEEVIKKLRNLPPPIPSPRNPSDDDAKGGVPPPDGGGDDPPPNPWPRGGAWFLHIKDPKPAPSCETDCAPALEVLLGMATKSVWTGQSCTKDQSIWKRWFFAGDRRQVKHTLNTHVASAEGKKIFLGGLRFGWKTDKKRELDFRKSQIRTRDALVKTQYSKRIVEILIAGEKFPNWMATLTREYKITTSLRAAIVKAAATVFRDLTSDFKQEICPKCLKDYQILVTEGTFLVLRNHFYESSLRLKQTSDEAPTPIPDFRLSPTKA